MDPITEGDQVRRGCVEGSFRVLAARSPVAPRPPAPAAQDLGRGPPVLAVAATWLCTSTVPSTAPHSLAHRRPCPGLPRPSRARTAAPRPPVPVAPDPGQGPSNLAKAASWPCASAVPFLHRGPWVQALQRTGTWEVVPLPLDVVSITCKWVYKVKTKADGSIERCKARLVARGFQ